MSSPNSPITSAASQAAATGAAPGVAAGDEPSSAIARSDLPPAGDPDHAHRFERSRRLRRNIAVSLLVKPLSMLVPLLSVPLFRKYLGLEGYGLYETAIALAGWIAMSQGGLSLGIVNKLMDCNVAGDRLLARRYLSTFFGALLVVSVVMMAIVTPVIWSVNWSRAFDVTAPMLQKQLPWVLWLTAAATLAAMLLSLPYAVYTAYQQIDRINVWEAITDVLVVGLSIGVVWTHSYLIGVALIMVGAPALIKGVNVIWMFTVERPWLRPSLRLFDFSLLKRVAAEGMCFFVLQLSLLALFQCDKLIIAKLLGAAKVTDYAIVGRVFMLGYAAYLLLLSPLWPAHGEAVRRGDFAWVRKALRISTLLGIALAFVCGGTLLVGGHWLLEIWTRGQGVHASRSLILAMTAMFALRAWVDSRSVILNSASILKPQMVFFGAHAILNVAVALFFTMRLHWGVEGVAWSTPITSLLTSAWGYPWMMRRYLKSSTTGVAQTEGSAILTPGSVA